MLVNLAFFNPAMLQLLLLVLGEVLPCLDARLLLPCFFRLPFAESSFLCFGVLGLLGGLMRVGMLPLPVRCLFVGILEWPGDDKEFPEETLPWLLAELRRPFGVRLGLVSVTGLLGESELDF